MNGMPMMPKAPTSSSLPEPAGSEVRSARASSSAVVPANALPPSAVDSSSPENFIRSIAPYAARVSKATGIPAEVLIGMAANETGFGKYAEGNNLFGIKGTGPAGSFSTQTWEDYGQGRVDIQDSFRAYHSPAESMMDFAKLVMTSPRYAGAMGQTSVTGFVDGLRRGGYMTDPAYVQKIDNITTRYSSVIRESLQSSGDGTPAASAVLASAQPVRAAGKGVIVPDQFGVGLPPDEAYAACYDGETRVLTRRGFVYFRDLTDDDELATRREDGLIEYHHALARQRFHYRGRMYHFKNLSVDLLVTPDHQMLAFATGRQYLPRDKVQVTAELVPAERIATSAHGWSIPVHSRWLGEGAPTESPARCTPEEWAAFVGLWLAEGHVESLAGSRRVSITQAVGPHSQAVRRIVGGLGVTYATQPHTGGRDSKLPAQRHRFTDAPVWSWLSRLGKSPARFIPRDLLQAHPEVLNALLMGLWLGDGSKGEHTVYTTSSKQLAEDVAELGVKLGCGAVIRTRQPRNPRWLPKYDVSLRPAEYYCVHPKRGNVSVIEDWDGEVFCATVPNHTLLVERNGKITWCGNCGPMAAIAFAQAYGRNPTVKEAMDLAKQSGWTSAGGMNGIANEKRLLDKMGIPGKLETAIDWSHVQADALNRNPIIISTPGHYYVIDGYDQRSGAYHVGQSGLAYRGGSEWMTPAQMTALSGAPHAALYTDNPLAVRPGVAVAPPPPGPVVVAPQTPLVAAAPTRPAAPPPPPVAQPVVSTVPVVKPFAAPVEKGVVQPIAPPPAPVLPTQPLPRTAPPTPANPATPATADLGNTIVPVTEQLDQPQAPAGIRTPPPVDIEPPTPPRPRGPVTVLPPQPPGAPPREDANLPPLQRLEPGSEPERHAPPPQNLTAQEQPPPDQTIIVQPGTPGEPGGHHIAAGAAGAAAIGSVVAKPQEQKPVKPRKRGKREDDE